MPTLPPTTDRPASTPSQPGLSDIGIVWRVAALMALAAALVLIDEVLEANETYYMLRRWQMDGLASWAAGPCDALKIVFCVGLAFLYPCRSWVWRLLVAALTAFFLLCVFVTLSG